MVAGTLAGPGSAGPPCTMRLPVAIVLATLLVACSRREPPPPPPAFKATPTALPVPASAPTEIPPPAGEPPPDVVTALYLSLIHI